MSIANSATCDTSHRPVASTAVAVGPDTSPAERLRIRVYPFPAACRSPEWWVPAGHRGNPAVGWQIREERGAYEIPDLLKDENYDPEPLLYDAACEHAEFQREAMALLDDAENLLTVLLDAIEDDGDSRAMQVEAVLIMPSSV